MISRADFLNRTRRDESGCLIWTAATTGAGYGTLWVDGRMVGAHRVSYELFVADIPEGLQIDHLCRTPRCVEPKHLEPVSRRENILRGTSPTAVNATATHCPRGHAYDAENTYVYNGGRGCRECRREWNREHRTSRPLTSEQRARKTRLQRARRDQDAS